MRNQVGQYFSLVICATALLYRPDYSLNTERNKTVANHFFFILTQNKIIRK